jgi:hypothetical protein
VTVPVFIDALDAFKYRELNVELHRSSFPWEITYELMRLSTSKRFGAAPMTRGSANYVFTGVAGHICILFSIYLRIHYSEI